MLHRIESKVGVALALCATLPACNQPAKADEAHPVPVKVEAVESHADLGPSRYSGSLEPASKVDLAFRVGGYVDALAQVPAESGKRAIDKGDFVKKGTLLARVRMSDYVQQLNAAQAQLREARANQILATQELERARNLFAGRAITQAELDAKVARADSAVAKTHAAEAQAGEAGISLTDTALRAPFDGVVLSRPLELGALVSPGQPVITIADTRTLKAVFGVPQVLVERIALGTPVSVFVGAESESSAPNKLLSAEVTRIAPSADANGRVFSVEASLPNENGALRPGSVVSVRVLDPSRPAQAPVVPLRAVIRSPHDPSAFAVFVLDGGADHARVRLRDVRLGDVVGNGVTVSSGLVPQERVVTVGATLLRDGSDVVVIR